VTRATWLAADFNGDRRSDVARVTPDRIAVWLNRGDGTYEQR
jgi:hypothetical protein